MKVTIKIGVIALNTESQLLLIREKYHDADGFKWNLIKGTYDNPNETLAECAKRELQEEAGLNIDLSALRLKEVYNYGDDNNPKMLFIFYTLNIDAKTELASSNDQKARGENIVESKWFSLQSRLALTEKDCIANYVYLALKNLNSNLENPNSSQVNFYKII